MTQSSPSARLMQKEDVDTNTIEWPNGADFAPEFLYQSFKTHDLKVLLRLSGAEAIMRNKYKNEWSVVSIWDPELRYKLVGSTSFQTASSMIAATKFLLREL